MKKKKKNTGVKRNHSRTHSKKGTNDDISHNIPTASLDSINQSINQYWLKAQSWQLHIERRANDHEDCNLCKYGHREGNTRRRQEPEDLSFVQREKNKPDSTTAERRTLRERRTRHVGEKQHRKWISNRRAGPPNKRITQICPALYELLYHRCKGNSMLIQPWWSPLRDKKWKNASSLKSFHDNKKKRDKKGIGKRVDQIIISDYPRQRRV